ncbi:MAG: hypothetical protein QMD32_06880 [Smithellaceae bacterium]|nr:hypothetical protein [Smithellaceae bacterium]
MTILGSLSMKMVAAISMVQGQAAGTACALSLRGETTPRSLEPSVLRTQLARDDVILEFA